MIHCPYQHPLFKDRLPWRSGRFLIGIGLKPVSAERPIFDRDHLSEDYRQQKLKALEEFPTQLIHEQADLGPQELTASLATIHQLAELSKNLDFRQTGLAVQEDFALWKRDQEREWLAALHLCSPNHWAPEEKIGHSFEAVHRPIPKIERISAMALKLFDQAYQSGPVERLAWGLATDTVLNHHPKAAFQGRAFNPERPELFVRLERQVLYPIADHPLLLFTIRTYFFEVATFERQDKEALISCLHSMDESLLQYKGLKAQKAALIEWLAG